MKRNELLDELTQITKQNLNFAIELQSLNLTQLNAKPNENSWSVLECLQHLNNYADFYHPEIRKRLASAKSELKSSSNESVKSTWLGKKFIDSIKLVKTNDEIQIGKKMNSPKNMNPALSESSLDIQTLNQFIKDQKDLLDLLFQSRNCNLERIKTSISISKIIKLRLCDTFRVIVYHNERHVWQAKNALKE